LLDISIIGAKVNRMLVSGIAGVQSQVSQPELVRSDRYAVLTGEGADPLCVEVIDGEGRWLIVV
jgi:hypothetical protein